MEETKKKKRKFLRKDWNKKIKLGKTVKKLRKWRAAKGRQNKIRLGRKGHITRPKIGFGSIKSENVLRIKNVQDLKKVKQGQSILIANVGKKKREEILVAAKEAKVNILNNYKEALKK